jgi:hypothetical protein
VRAVFSGKVEWTDLVSTKTGEPIATLTADNPEGFALGLAKRILGPLGAQWFYEGESLGYWTISQRIRHRAILARRGQLEQSSGRDIVRDGFYGTVR